MTVAPTPEVRQRRCNDAPVRPDGEVVLYWMIAARRTTHNLALQRAVEHAERLGKPLLVFEPLRCDYRWASPRFHRFVLDGMADNARALESTPAGYYPYVEPEPGAGKGLLAALARDACIVVTDDFPAFFLPRMIGQAAESLPVRVEAIDSNGLLPVRATDRVFTTAHSFRRFLQKELPAHLDARPLADPIGSSALRPFDTVPADITRRWPSAGAVLGEADAYLATLPHDHAVPAVDTERGGPAAGAAALTRFLDERLADYAEVARQPESAGTSHLSAYLHFGHVGSHQVLAALAAHKDWSPHDITDITNGARAGWWNLDEASEAFLDQLVTWRELGFNMCAHAPGHDTYDSLPDWARATLEDHAGDRRPSLYEFEAFERAETHDPLWNATQNQLVRDGRIHTYLRMLWGKKILEWTASPREALDVMIELNNKYALDGRDPNSYSGIFWVLGRYDRAWGPERSVFGKIRYMTSQNTARKVRVGDYIRRYATATEP